MSWSRRSVLAGLGLSGLTLAGCGFTPVYQGRARGQVAVIAPQTPLGYALLERLEDRFGPPSAPLYQLEVALSVDEASERAAHHRSLIGQAEWTLTGAAQASGRVRHMASYLTDDTTVSLESARRDARARLAQGLADRVMTAVWAALP